MVQFLGSITLHPVVRRYAYERLVDKEGTHAYLRDYFTSRSEPRRVERLDDLAPVIELYYHTARAGRYDEACRLMRERISPALFYEFGAYGVRLELLTELLPGGKVKTPKLSSVSDQAYVLSILAGSYAMLGQSDRAIDALELGVRLSEDGQDVKQLTRGLSYLVMERLKLGRIASAYTAAERMIQIGQQIENEIVTASGLQRLSLLMIYTGDFQAADRTLGHALGKWEQVKTSKHTQEQALSDWEQAQVQQGSYTNAIYRSLLALLQGDYQTSIANATVANRSASAARNQRDVIRAEWLLGASSRVKGDLEAADVYLNKALTQCRRISLVELEATILLEVARLQRDQHHRTEQVNFREDALRYAKEALSIATRCEYRLLQADIHNFLAQWELDIGNLREARYHALTARERARCDAPSHRYGIAYTEAEQLLEQVDTLG